MRNQWGGLCTTHKKTSLCFCLLSLLANTEPFFQCFVLNTSAISHRQVVIVELHFLMNFILISTLCLVSCIVRLESSWWQWPRQPRARSCPDPNRSTAQPHSPYSTQNTTSVQCNLTHHILLRIPPLSNVIWSAESSGRKNIRVCTIPCVVDDETKVKGIVSRKFYMLLLVSIDR
jgi:hypothetical protein